MSDLSLAYGARAAIPEGVECAWGARWIWPNDLVWDRQDMAGPEGERTRLQDWLNNGPQPLRRALEEAAELAKHYELRPNDDRLVTLYENEAGIIVGNPQGSSGYLYVAAWLKP